MRENHAPLRIHAYVVLGMLRLGARSGYDIKQVIDLAAQHFWTISYPQIYPELDVLQERGLISGKNDQSSGRRRRLYRLTKAGERELEQWLSNREDPFIELRDAGLLKVFLTRDASQAQDQLALMRKRSEDTIARLESRASATAAALAREGNPFPALSVEFGIELHRAMVRTCRKAERELAD